MGKNLLNILFVIAFCFCNHSNSLAETYIDDFLHYFNSNVTKSKSFDIPSFDMATKAWELSGSTLDNDKKTIFKIAKDLSDKGYSLGDWFLGWCYEGGEGCEFNPDLAFNYFMKAATAEIPFCWAYRSLAYCYMYGNGTAIDNNEVYKWFKKATETIKADSSLAGCYLGLGHCYNNGWYVPRDIEKAISCYNKVIEAEYKDYSVHAASNLAVIYNNEKHDYSKSYYYARMAADLGDQDWQLLVGNALLTGFLGKLPVDKDRNQAITYLRKAASQGNVDAYIRLNELGL